MPINKDELSKLSPKDRLKKLKLLEEERRKEVDEIGGLIKKSMQELRTEKLAEEIAPEQKPVDISRLFEVNLEQKLERTANEAPAFAKGTKAYQAVAQTYEVYSQLQKLDRVFSTYGSLTEEQKNLVGQIGERITVAERYMPEGEKTASLLDASRATLQKLKKETGIE